MLAVKNVGEPCAGEPHARIDGGREETRAQSAMPCDPGASRLPDHPPANSHARRSGRLARLLPTAAVGAGKQIVVIDAVAGLRSAGAWSRPEQSSQVW